MNKENESICKFCNSEIMYGNEDIIEDKKYQVNTLLIPF